MSTGCVRDTSRLIAFSTGSICLLILLIILVKSIKELGSHAIQRNIKIFYFIAITCSIICITIYSIFSIICVNDSQLPFYWAVFEGFYSFLCLSVVIILLFRLYYTFKKSIFEISKFQKWLFLITPLILIILVLFGVIGNFVHRLKIYLRLIGIGTGFALYLGISFYAMILFVHKMHGLIKMEHESIEQKELLHMTTKYVTLLSFALISTWITFLFSVIDIIWSDMYILQLMNGILACIDCLINIICLHLQFPFARLYYDKYCGCFSAICVFIITGNNIAIYDTQQMQLPTMRIQVHSNGISMNVDDQTPQK